MEKFISWNRNYEPYVGTRPVSYTIPHGIVVDISEDSDLIKAMDKLIKKVLNEASQNEPKGIPSIQKVYSNAPYTIVLWSDMTKTIVKAQDGEVYDPEKGLAMAIAKRALGNKGSYYEVFKRYLIWPEEVEMLEKEDSSHD